jgi:hypothetical protein
MLLKRMEIEIASNARFCRGIRDGIVFETRQSIWSRIWDWLVADV